MFDVNLFRVKISEVRSGLDKIEHTPVIIAEVKSRLNEIALLLDNYEVEINQEKRFNHRIPHLANATADDFFASMDVISNSRNALIREFLTELGFRDHYYYPDKAKKTLQSFSAYYVFLWLTEKDQREIERFRNVGKKGMCQIVKFLSTIEDALSTKS